MEQTRCILFSPISKFDPISQIKDETGAPTACYDGPALHIARKYNPQKVYFYLTKDFDRNARPNADLCKVLLERLLPGTRVEFIDGDPALDVHHFDQIGQAYREALTNIYDREHAEAEKLSILLNLSSGTPQMQAALYLVAATLPFSTAPVQADSPRAPQTEECSKNDLEENALGRILDLLQTQTADRTHSVTCQNVYRVIYKDNIEKLIQNAEYNAAKDLCEKGKAYFVPAVKKQLRRALAHYTLDEQALREFAPDDDFYEFPEKIIGSDARQCYDYLLYMKALLHRKAYSDFCRALSPAITRVMCLRLKSIGYDIEPFTEKGEDGIQEFKAERIKKADHDFYNEIEKERGWNERAWSGEYVSAKRLLEYMNYLRDRKAKEDKKLIDVAKTFKDLRDVEQGVRNLAAHEMVGITCNVVSKKAGMEPGKILRLLQQEYQSAVGAEELKWDGLERINKQILQEMGKEP